MDDGYETSLRGVQPEKDENAKPVKKNKEKREIERNFTIFLLLIPLIDSDSLDEGYEMTIKRYLSLHPILISVHTP